MVAFLLGTVINHLRFDFGSWLFSFIVRAILDDRGQVMMQVDVPVIQSSFLHVALTDTKKLPLCLENKQEVKS